jgi:hypothetical protein
VAENQPQNDNSDAMSTLRAEVEAFRTDRALCAREAVVAAAERFLALPVAAGREAERDALVRNFMRDARAKISAQVGNVLGSEMTRTRYALNLLARPVPRPSEIERIRGRLFEVGCNGALHDVVAARLRGEAKAGAITKSGIEIDGTFQTWADLIEYARPASWTRVETWRAQFASLPDDPSRPVRGDDA